MEVGIVGRVAGVGARSVVDDAPAVISVGHVIDTALQARVDLRDAGRGAQLALLENDGRPLMQTFGEALPLDQSRAMDLAWIRLTVREFLQDMPT